MFHLRQNESLKLSVRKHWFILFEHMAVLAFVFIAPFVLYGFMQKNTISFIPSSSFSFSFMENPALLIFIGATWSLFVWMKCAGIFTDYYLDVWIVTDKRVVDIEQFGFFHREVATVRIENIQDVTVEIKGLFATILDFGTIRVQSAGESREFVAHGIPRPHRVKEIILKQHDHNTS